MKDLNIVPLQHGDDSEPLIFIHALTGTILPYKHLIECLSCTRSIYGIEAVGLDGNMLPFEHVGSIAAHYADAIQERFSNNRLILIGWSFGGLVAAELAALLMPKMQLRLALLDVQRLNNERKNRLLSKDEILLEFAYTLLGNVDRAAHSNLNNLASLPEKRKFSFVLDMLLTTKRTSSPELLQNMYRVFCAHLHAHDRYIPIPISNVKALFIKAQRQPFDNQDASLGWSNIFSSKLEIVTAPGDHYSLLNQHALTTAKYLNTWIDKIDS